MSLYTLYILGAIISWFLCSGWFFANVLEDDNLIDLKEIRYHSGMAIIVGGIYSIVWPITMPACFLMTGYASWGWRAVWDLKVKK